MVQWFTASIEKNFKLSNCQIVKLSNCQIVELSNCQIVELSNCRIVELSNCQIVELSNCRIVELSNCQIVKLSNHHHSGFTTLFIFHSIQLFFFAIYAVGLSGRQRRGLGRVAAIAAASARVRFLAGLLKYFCAAASAP
jgi:hypothetical protein